MPLVVCNNIVLVSLPIRIGWGIFQSLIQLLMTVTLIPYRTLHFSVPNTLALSVLRTVLDNEIKYSIERISDDKRFMCLVLSVDLSKAYQCNAAAAIEKLVTT